MKDQVKFIIYTRRNGLKPLPKTSVSKWADKYRQLSVGISAEPGKWRTSCAPYQKEIMDAFTDSNIHRVIVMSAAQIGKSDKFPFDLIQSNEKETAVKGLEIKPFTAVLIYWSCYILYFSGGFIKFYRLKILNGCIFLSNRL